MKQPTISSQSCQLNKALTLSLFARIWPAGSFTSVKITLAPSAMNSLEWDAPIRCTDYDSDFVI